MRFFAIASGEIPVPFPWSTSETASQNGPEHPLAVYLTGSIPTGREDFPEMLDM